MRIIHLLLIGILISLTAATALSKNDKSSKKTTVKPLVNEAKTTTKPTKSTGTTTSLLRSAKSLKSSKPGENRGKRTLYDFNNPAYLYPQIAARRAGYETESRSAYSTQNGYFNGQNAIAQFPSDYHLNYSPYPQYLEAPEPIIEIIIKDANDTLPETNVQPLVTKTKKKKEKVHVFYVNYKKDQNNKLHLESPIASLNNDETEEEEEEEEIVHYPVTPLPPVKSTTLRTIIHPDSEKYHSNSGIHVTFGSEDKSQKGHILEEHDAESVQSPVVALPVPPSTSLKSQYQVNSRNDFQGQARSPFSSSFFQSSAPWQYQAQHQQQQFHSQQQQQHQQQAPIQQQQLPNKHSTTYFKAPSSSTPPQHVNHHNSNQQHHSSNYQQKPTFHTQPAAQKPHHTQPSATTQTLPSSNRFSLSQIHQQLQQQSQYYVNHNQLYPSQTPQQQPQQQQHTQPQQQQQHHNAHHHHHQQQSTVQHNQYYNAVSHKPSQTPPKSQVVFPTAPPKTQELPVRHSPQPYQPIKFRPTPAAAPTQTKPTPITAKLENTQYNNKNLYQFQKQPQYIQHPTFTIPSPTLPPSHANKYNNQIQLQPQTQQYHQQQQQQHHQTQTNQHQYQTQNQAQIQHHQQQQQQTLVQPQSTTNSLYFNQNKQQQQQHNQQTQQQQTTRYQTQSSNQQSSSTLPNGGNLGWLDIKPSKETELLKSIPKFEQHITETVENHYNTNQYQTQSQVLHDMPAPNLAPQQQQQQPQSQALHGHYITASNTYNTQPQQQQQQFSNFVTASSNLQYNQQQFVSSTQTPQFAESTDGQKIMIVTPMPPNVYQQYQAAHAYQTAQSSNTNQQQSTQIINSIQPSQEQYNNYYQQPRQGQSATQAQTTNNSPFSVSNYHSDVFKELEQRNSQTTELKDNNQNAYIPPTTTPATTTSPASTTVNPKTLLQLPDEVPDELRQQLLTSGILGNADISVLDYDKVGDIALENLPAEHLQHFYGAGGGAQISESQKVLTVLKPNGDKVSLDEKEIQRVKESNSVPHNKQTDVKVVRYDGQKLEQSEQPSTSGERQYNRYLPLKINGANFPKPESEELKGKSLQSIVVLAPVDTPAGQEVQDTKEVKFLGGDLIKTLVKKPTKENFKRWLEKEARTDVEQQSVVLLVAKSSNSSEQEIFMYDITTGEVNKLNGELSSKFVSVAEENASTEDLEHGSTLDPNFMETMMQPLTS